MKYGIISDIHSNHEALVAVFHNLGKVDKIICLGDIVGYGANPNECTGKIRETDAICIAGNHDLASVDLLDTQYFNSEAGKAIVWTSKQLNTENRYFLKKLKDSINFGHNILAVHGSPGKLRWNYIADSLTAETIFRKYAFNILFIGHSHLAECFSEDKMGNKIHHQDLSCGGRFRILENRRYIINCGSVGQPRDGNPNASYAVYDDNNKEITIKRIKYPINVAQKKILGAKLPEIFACRLSVGR